MMIASGVSPVAEMRAAGVAVGLGTDGPAGSNNDLDLMEEIDLAAKLAKITKMDPLALNAKAVVEMATIDGARALHMEKEIGSLEAGKKADLILISLDEPNAVPMYDIYAQLAYALKGSDVETVVIGGRVVMRDRKLLTVNEEAAHGEGARIQEVDRRITGYAMKARQVPARRHTQSRSVLNPCLDPAAKCLLLHDLRSRRCRRSVAAALRADDAIHDHHANPWQVSALNALEHGLSRRMLGFVDHHESGGAARGNQSAVQFSDFRRVAGGKTDCDLGRYLSERRQHRNHAQDAERLHPRPAGESVPRITRSSCFSSFAVRSVSNAARSLPLWTTSNARVRFLAQSHDLIVGQRGVAAVDVSDDIGVGREHDVFVNQAGTGNRGAAGVDGALNPEFARPGHHLPRRGAVFHASQADLAQHGDARRGQVFEIFLDHSVLNHRRAGVNSHAAGSKGRERPLGKNRHGLQPDHIFRTAGSVHFAGGNHAGDSAMQVAVDPANLVLARRPVAGHRMHVAVDQSRSQGRAFGIDDQSRAFAVDVFLPYPPR